MFNGGQLYFYFSNNSFSFELYIFFVGSIKDDDGMF